MMERNSSLFTSVFDDNQLENEILQSNPMCFHIIGKPGSGKTTLAKNLAAVWKSVLINDTTILEELIGEESHLGSEAKADLQSGKELTETFVAKIISNKLESSNVQSYGYILDCLPTISDTWKNVTEQIEFIRNLKLKPTVIINLKISDQELERRRTAQRLDPNSNVLYTCPISISNTKNDDIKENEDDDTESNEENEKEDTELDIFGDDMNLIFDSKNSAAMINDQLIQRPNDITSNVEKEVQLFRNVMLKHLEDLIVGHDRQYVIELDANLPAMEVFKSLLIHLDHLGLSHSPVPIPLFNDEEDDEMDGIDSEQFLHQLADTGTLLPKFRWRRSKWGRYCPVQLSQGNMTLGKMEFSVGFLDKMYSMSSDEAFKEFILSPRTFLLPPFPRIPCKICVLGPPTSGKSTMSKMLSEHYDAMVLNIQQLLVPVIAKERNRLIEEAQQEAINAIMSSSEETSDIEVNQDHPDVMKAVEVATVNINSSPVSITQEMYMEALKNGIDMAEQKKRMKNPNGPRFGGWIVDSFPMTRENWIAMIDNELLPDFVINLKDDHAPENFLLSRFTQMHNLPVQISIKKDDELNVNKDEKEDIESVKVPELVTLWHNAKSDYTRQWNQLSASIKGSAIDPITVDCSLPVNDMVSSAISQLDGIFSVRSLEYSFFDDDASADDDPDLKDESDDEEEDDEDGDKEDSWQYKPWGDTRHFCPVALKNSGILWPGNNEIAMRYKEKIYCFSSKEAKEKFIANPTEYTAPSKPIVLPPLRIFLLGAKGSGKTSVGRHLAAKLGVFHISFRDFLQEKILSKVKKPPLVDDDEWEGGEDESTHEGTDFNESDMELNLKMPLTEEELEIQSYLLNEDHLTEEVILKHLEQFWFEEPYKSTGFILEGFPSKPEELRLLADKGFYPDAAIVLQVEVSNVINRVLPARLAAWTRKRNNMIAKKQEIKNKMMKEWKDDKERRKAELKTEYENKIASISKSSSEEDEDNELEDYNNDYLEQVAEIDEEEAPEMEDSEEEETKDDAVERMKATISEQVEEQIDSISFLQDVYSELKIPYHTVNACRKLSVVKFSAEKMLLPYNRDREGLLTKCTKVDSDIAKTLLDYGYKFLSTLKKWCPVKLLENPHSVLPPAALFKSQQFPVIYRQHVYFTSSLSNRSLFMANPHKYIFQQPPGPAIPITLSIVGPPKSGKTTIAKKFCSEYGCIRLSIGEVLRTTITKFPNSKLSELILSHLKSGLIVPEDLCLLALENALLDVHCCTRGYVLDGWPLTKSQVDLLTKFHIIPVCILELKVNESEVLRRGKKDRNSLDRTYPVHDSDAILLIRSKQYYANIESVKIWYSYEHDNWHEVEGTNSKWWVWEQCKDLGLHCALQIQQYLSRISSGQAASIEGLCVTPSDFKSRLGEFDEHCPVNLALHGELVDCSTTRSLKYAAEYKGRYYKMLSYEDLQLFLSNPDSFVPPKAPYTLPPSHLLPKKKSSFDVKALFPKQFEINGFCPVCYVDGNKQYESLLSGSPDYSAEYCNKLFCFCSELHLEKYMRRPDFYEISNLPSKLPPLKQPTLVTTLPMLGYMEQTVATAIIESLNALGNFKPKFPFFSATKSALHYVGLYLKAFNPKSNKYIRQKYKKKLLHFEDQCKLVSYLSSNMKHGYKQPLQLQLSFDQKMNSFIDLK